VILDPLLEDVAELGIALLHLNIVMIETDHLLLSEDLDLVLLTTKRKPLAALSRFALGLTALQDPPLLNLLKDHPSGALSPAIHLSLQNLMLL
jgi:hypothetical protein